MAFPVREINPTGFLNELDLSETVKQSNKEDLYLFLDPKVLTKKSEGDKELLSYYYTILSIPDNNGEGDEYQ